MLSKCFSKISEKRRRCRFVELLVLVFEKLVMFPDVDPGETFRRNTLWIFDKAAYFLRLGLTYRPHYFWKRFPHWWNLKMFLYRRKTFWKHSFSKMVIVAKERFWPRWLFLNFSVVARKLLYRTRNHVQRRSAVKIRPRTVHCYPLTS